MLHALHLIDNTDTTMVRTRINRVETRVQGFICDHIRIYHRREKGRANPNVFYLKSSVIEICFRECESEGEAYLP